MQSRNVTEMSLISLLYSEEGKNSVLLSGKFAMLPFYLGYLCFPSSKFTLNKVNQRKDCRTVESLHSGFITGRLGYSLVGIWQISQRKQNLFWE